MDRDDEDGVADILGRPRTWGYGMPPPPRRVPRRGEDPEFDAHCDRVLGSDFDGNQADEDEMRRAMWATWRTAAPTTREISTGRSGHEDVDDQLAFALAESARHHAARAPLVSNPDDPIVIPDDDDEDLRRAIQMSKEDSRVAKRPRREETPEEERRMLAEAMAASLAASSGDLSVQEISDDEEIEKANAVFQASRQAFREEEKRKRETVNSKPTSNSAALPIPPLTLSGTGQTKDVSKLITSEKTSTRLSPVPRSAAGGLLGDRAQMERERLARQAARAAQIGGSNGITAEPRVVHIPGPKTSTDGSRIATVSDWNQPQNGAGPSTGFSNGATKVASQSSKSTSHARHPLQSAGPFPSDEAGECYLDGEMRHTALTIGEPTSERTFSPDQVIGDKRSISLIVISSFVTDDEWLETILPSAENVPRVYIRPHPKENHPAWNGKVQAQVNGEVRCYPQMVGDWGSAHMKFAWVFYRTGRLRVAIMTCNMVPYDWESIENTVYVQDFLPRRRPGSASLSSDLEDFPARFRYLFVHLKVHKALRHLIEKHPKGSQIPFKPADAFSDLSEYDWSRVKVKLVMSVPGTYTGADKMDDFGLSRLGKVLSENGWKPQSGEMVQAEFQGSSLGSYNLEWFDTFYQYCCGKTTQILAGKIKATSWPPIKIIFPSLATVEKSSLGKDGGGTMFCGKAYNAVTKHLFHDAKSKRGGVLVHSKVLMALFEPRPDSLGFQSTPPRGGGKRKADEMGNEDEGVGGWVYVGSHNFSSAAWGTVALKKSPPTLNVRNYELGIVFPLPRKDARTAADVIAPYKRPPRPYSASDIPWDQSTHQASGQ